MRIKCLQYYYPEQSAARAANFFCFGKQKNLETTDAEKKSKFTSYGGFYNTKKTVKKAIKNKTKPRKRQRIKKRLWKTNITEEAGVKHQQ